MLKQWIVVTSLIVVSPPLFAQTASHGAKREMGQAAPTQSPGEWQRKYDMAVKYHSLEDFYNALKQEAAGKPKLPLPDWSGIWTADTFDSFAKCLGGNQCFFRPAPGLTVGPKVTPTAAAELKRGKELSAKGLVYDENLSNCGPSGFPRWIGEPFMREMIVTPDESWLTTEQLNEIRRVYTDGRGHTPEKDRYPLIEGDSIGFWDGQKLVIHTNQVDSRPMGRNQPIQSEQMETVEIWEKINPTTIAIDEWLFDPRLYLEPWYMRRLYGLVPNPEKSLRVRYWDCNENSNNAVTKSPDGDTYYQGFDFSGKKSDKPKQ
jgi:hypothetical protein